MRNKGKIRSYFVCEPKQLSLNHILKTISKCLGNGIVNQVENNELNYKLMNSLSTLNFKQDHSFFYYFLNPDEIQEESKEDNEELEDFEDENLNKSKNELILDHESLFKGNYIK